MSRSPRGKQPGKLRRSVLLALLFILPFTFSLFAQNRNTGEIRGTVTDSSGARVSGAKVVVTDTDTGITTTVVTGEAGFYDAPLLETGQYSIEFSKGGFKKFVRRGIVLHVDVITVDTVLNVGSATESVVVTADVPLVQTETSDRSTVFVEKTVNDLPNFGRSWFDILGQLPGVNPGGSEQDASGQSVGVNGAAAWQENWLVDGGVNTLPISQNPGQMVPLDDIAEVDLNTSNFSAEYGSGVAVFNVITKSGGNQFHGSLYEFLQNDIFEARNYFAQSTTPLRWHMFGGTIGGPILRNKAFFFFSYQRNPSIAYTPTYYTFPTAAMKGLNNPEGNADFSDPSLPIIYDPNTYNPATQTRTAFPGNIIPANRIDPVAKAIQAYLPLPNIPGLPAGVGNNYYYNARNTNLSVSYNGKIDYDVSAKNRLSGSFMFNPGNSFNPSPTCPMGTGGSSGCQNSVGKESQMQITETWSAGPGLVNEARVSFLRQYGIWSTPDQGQGFPAKIGLPNPLSDTFPNIGIDGAVTTGIGGGLHASLVSNAFMYSDTVTWLKGKHVFKFGGEFDRYQDNQAWANMDSGDYDFSGVFTMNPAEQAGSNPPPITGYADFLLGLPDNWGVGIAPETGLRDWNLHVFVQDDYKMKPHLTLNLGLRYARQSGWTEVENRIANFDPTLLNPGTGTLGAVCFAGQTFGGHYCPRAQQQTTNLYQPRIGFAWSPKDTWSVRSAYGIFQMMTGANNYTSGWAPGWGIGGSLTSPDFVTPVFPLSQGPPPGSVYYPSAAARTPDGLNGQGITYLPYHTPPAYIQQWHLDIQHQILGHIGLDAAYVGSRGVHLLFPRDIDQVPEALLGTGTRPYPQFNGIGANLYDGISNYHSLQLSARTLVSHGLSFRVNYTFAKAQDEITTQGWSGNVQDESYQNAYDPSANYGLAAFDVPRLLNGNVVYELPFGQGRKMLNRGGLVNGFLGGWQLSSTFQVHSGLPFTPVMADNLTFALAGVQYPNRVGNGTLAHPTPNLWFDPTAFVSPGLDTFGDSGRHILRGPDYRGVNLSLAKHFEIRKIGERGDLEMRVDAYNAFNHPNFGMPDPNIGDGTTGTITSTAGSFSNPGSRNLQLGAKLSF